MPAHSRLQRLLVLVALLAAGAAVFAGLRRRSVTPLADPPEWPPLTTRDDPPVTSHGEAAWAEPGEDGSCPAGFPVKVKESSGIYHLPDGRFYERTNADRCYVDAPAAESDGYRRSKS